MADDKPDYRRAEPCIGERNGAWTYLGGGVSSAPPAFSSEQYETEKENLVREIIIFIN